MTKDVMNLFVLAIARPESNVVCVAGINEIGEWIRPQRVYESDIENFDLFGITKIYVDVWKGRTVRQEDRFLIKEAGKMPELIECLKDSEIKSFLESHLDGSVNAVFKSGRTLGLIKPQKPISIRGNINKIWMTFPDSTGEQFTWSVRDVFFYKKVSAYSERYPADFIKKLDDELNKSNTYFVIGLTQIYPDNPHSEYGGWPMIVGIHCL